MIFSISKAYWLLISTCWASFLVIQLGLPALACADADTLTQIRKQYSRLTSYKDSGTVETKYFKEGKHEFSDHKTFNTYYSSPDKFRFEWVENTPSKSSSLNILVAVGDEIVTHLGKSGYEYPKDLKTAIFSIAGLSSGSSYAIPSLLLEDIPTQDIESFDSITEEKITGADGNPITKIKLRYPSGTIETITYDEQRMIITEVTRERVQDKKKVIETISYTTVHINSPIPDHEFIKADNK